MKELILHHDILKPVAFYPYTSIVMAPIISIGYCNGDPYHQLHMELVAFFSSAGIKCHVDNKTVFELADKMIPHRRIYIGFYDNKMHIGFNYRRMP